MAAVWPNESAGKHKSGRSRPGSKRLAATLAQCAQAAGRSKATSLGAQSQRLRGRRAHAKARKAVTHSILVAAYHVLERHVPYQDLGADWLRAPWAPCPPESSLPTNTTSWHCDGNQLGGRFSMKACTPSSALGSIMLQAIVAPASS